MKVTWGKTLTVAVLAGLLLAGCETLDSGLGQSLLGALGKSQELTPETIASGLREALVVGTQNAVAKTSQKGGYADNPLLRIAMPQELQKVAQTLRGIGLDSVVDDFEAKMNQGAEQAAAKATPVFVDAIKKMTLQDAKGILSGGQTAATDYFRTATSTQLRDLYSPIVRKSMEQVGAVRVYDSLMSQYAKLPMVTKPQFSLDQYVSGKAVDGLFTVIADEERKIRENPAARTTELLRRVFGSVTGSPAK